MQSKSINVNFGHFRQYTKVIALLFGQNGSFSSLFNVQSQSINVNVGHFSAKYQGYSLTFWSNMAHFHHFSMCSQNQSMSILVISHQNTKVIALLFGQKWLFGQFSPKYQGYSLNVWPNMAQFHHFSMCSQNQSMSILVILRQNTKVIALLFGQTWLIFITFQCAVKINQCQFWSFLTKKTKVIALIFGQNWLNFITFQCAVKINQCQFWSFFGKIPRL